LNVVVREARASDKKPLMDFVAKTWGGHDYIPSVWDEWLHDRAGRIFVAEVDGEQVGMNRVRFLPNGTGWLEGARIRPDFRGKGLASFLGKKSMEYASKFGVRTFRLTSGSHNKAAQKQVSKMGFKEVGRFDVFKAGRRSKSKAQGGVRRVSSKNAKRTMEIIGRSDEFRLGRGVYWDSFVVPSLDQDALNDLIRKRYVFTEEDGKGNSAIAISGLVGEGKNAWQQISFLCGKPALCKSLVSNILHASGSKKQEKYAFLPAGSKLSKILREIGMKKNFQMVLFEGRLD